MHLRLHLGALGRDPKKKIEPFTGNGSGNVRTGAARRAPGAWHSHTGPRRPGVQRSAGAGAPPAGVSRASRACRLPTAVRRGSGS